MTSKLNGMSKYILGGKATRCVGYGHIGDGNLHLNVTTPRYSQVIQTGIVYQCRLCRGQSHHALRRVRTFRGRKFTFEHYNAQL